jgi:hypothetical protein
MNEFLTTTNPVHNSSGQQKKCEKCDKFEEIVVKEHQMIPLCDRGHRGVLFYKKKLKFIKV